VSTTPVTGGLRDLSNLNRSTSCIQVHNVNLWQMTVMTHDSRHIMCCYHSATSLAQLPDIHVQLEEQKDVATQFVVLASQHLKLHKRIVPRQQSPPGHGGLMKGKACS
jgi:hypothetical protein